MKNGRNEIRPSQRSSTGCENHSGQINACSVLGGIVLCYGFFTAQCDEAVALKIPDELMGLVVEIFHSHVFHL
jgi:hypothetical protein